MSLRWSSYVAPKSGKGGLKTQNGRFSSKIELRLKKVCYKVSLCENCQRQSCRAFIGLTIHAKMIGGDVPFYLKFCVKWPRWSEITDFRSICARSVSTVTPSEKSSINTNRTSTMRFPMKFLGITTLKWVEFYIFLLSFVWALWWCTNNECKFSVAEQ